MRTQMFVQIASALVALPLLAMPGFTADSGGGSGGGGGGGSGGSSSGGSSSGGGGAEDAVDCRSGLIYNPKTRKCEAPQQGMIYGDDSIYLAGRALARDGRYDEAITMLTKATDKTDPRILNYLGYSHRKAGRVVVGLGYYQEALLNNPDYTLVREYMGEAYLQLGEVAKAREQLVEIERRCGIGCSEYSQLAERIEAYLRG